MDLKDKIVLITGSTDGLGKRLAFALSQNGAKVIIHGRDKKKVDEVVKEVRAIKGVVCDFNDIKTISDSFSTIDKLDILVNNAGAWLEGNTIEAPVEKIIELANTNLASHLLVTRTLLPILQKAEFGQILNTISVAGIEIPAGYFHTIYSATKFGMQGFSEAMAKEFDNKNLRVMGFYPGGMETKLFRKAGNDYKEHEPWMFDTKESVEAIIFMLTRNPKVNIKRLDLINHLQE
ncbi:hypothetical protein A2865_03260 [Candidatus Woesebacteria bacterium RIFCSPHIGHO2_01_FULL_39_17]|uniref:Short chain dehydrogenase n=3 Tax=Candidatus Woeseibacteriota TaxID=1752722 RepID=A0A0G0RJ56_9BACT|nr:MAG: Short chain dehydrogenase [Microgenomates group bacterium GW2011_GWC1_38_12]KKQ93485.1 MAG: Short chain dehydrogenase [Candidatus Woesebacteria bacterium GW2011_GWB1_39_10b]KKR13647.1 MAG: Short chain dehydrogenase [Candidatus Woesebacteria bacterium GW2011_GWA1_39_21b]OGM23244.1 MAG: hypothetical protein A2865_03260 [Candidatus Woesebacteria bacterium RIFCSPHIGHO2_01_FULL_39_17]OGM65696.1 MAG: hypothetical protein A3A52_05210 [Candidatus Woesebacteria bacterium RIFCSPLOWO2_01_FULL_39_1